MTWGNTDVAVVVALVLNVTDAELLAVELIEELALDDAVLVCDEYSQFDTPLWRCSTKISFKVSATI